MPILKSSRANYILISDNGFIRRNCYFLKERIQIVCMKQPVNIETYLQFLDFWADIFTYFILNLLNSRSTSNFYKPTRLFAQVYITFLRFEIQARDDEHCSTNDEHYNKMSREEKEKVLSHF